MKFPSLVLRPLAGGLAVFVLSMACGGSTPPPEAPDPSLEESEGSEAGAVAPTSNASVRAGVDAIQRGDFEAAKRALEQARSEAPNDPQAAFYHGVALQNLGDVDGARAAYERALELDAKLVEASVNLSALLLDTGASERAAEVAAQGLAAAPGHADLLLNRALALENTGKRDEAIAAYGKAVDARPNDAETHIAYADLLAASGKRDLALEQLKQASETDDPKLLAAVAHWFGRLKAPAECIAALDRAIERSATAELHTRRGVCRNEQGDSAGAKADYDRALAMDESFAPAHYYLGMHLRAKDKKAALTHLKKASELGKDGPVGKAARDAVAELEKRK